MKSTNDYLEKAKKLSSSVAQLTQCATQKNIVSIIISSFWDIQQEEKKKFRLWLLDQLQALETFIKENNILSSESLGAVFVPEASTIWERLFTGMRFQR